MLSRTKCVFPHQIIIKPETFKLTTCRGHINLLTVFSFVNCEEKGCDRVVSVGHLIFDCRSYCGRSCRMQGGDSLIVFSGTGADYFCENYGYQISSIFIGSPDKGYQFI